MRLVRLTESGAGKSSTTAHWCFSFSRGNPFALPPSPSSSYERLANFQLMGKVHPDFNYREVKYHAVPAGVIVLMSISLRMSAISDANARRTSWSL
jgi:hypothetical protein